MVKIDVVVVVIVLAYPHRVPVARIDLLRKSEVECE
jgi:hypothetical protein